MSRKVKILIIGPAPGDLAVGQSDSDPSQLTSSQAANRLAKVEYQNFAPPASSPRPLCRILDLEWKPGYDVELWDCCGVTPPADGASRSIPGCLLDGHSGILLVGGVTPQQFTTHPSVQLTSKPVLILQGRDSSLTIPTGQNILMVRVKDWPQISDEFNSWLKSVFNK